MKPAAIVKNWKTGILDADNTEKLTRRMVRKGLSVVVVGKYLGMQ